MSSHVGTVVARLHLGNRALDLPRRRHEHLSRRCIGLLRRDQLELNDCLFLAEGEYTDAGGEVAVDRLDAELVLHGKVLNGNPSKADLSAWVETLSL